MTEGSAEGTSLEKVNGRNDMTYYGSCQHLFYRIYVFLVLSF